MEKYVKFSELSDSTYFWRKGNPVRWLKASSKLVFSFDKPNEDKQMINVDEIVLIDPVYCYSCKMHTLFEEEKKECDLCGAVSLRFSKEKTRSVIIDWTGNPNPHL